MDKAQYLPALLAKQLGLHVLVSAAAVAASRTSCLHICAIMLSQMLQGHHSLLNATCKTQVVALLVAKPFCFEELPCLQSVTTVGHHQGGLQPPGLLPVWGSAGRQAEAEGSGACELH